VKEIEKNKIINFFSPNISIITLNVSKYKIKMIVRPANMNYMLLITDMLLIVRNTIN
jgi:hypothetical protein